MKPIDLIHGYSAKSGSTDHASIAGISGNLPADLTQNYRVVEIELSRKRTERHSRVADAGT